MTSTLHRTRSDVLVIPEETVAHLYRKSGLYTDEQSISDVLNAIIKHGQYVKREWAENTEKVKQIIAYGIIRNENKILCLRRTKKSNRKALRLRYTVLVGGHVDNADLDKKDIVKSCLIREIDEELGIKDFGLIRQIGVVVDTETTVGRLHIGLIYDVQIHQSSVVLYPELDNKEFVNLYDRTDYPLQDYDELLNKAKKFDPWSKLILSDSSIRELLCAKNWFECQLSLPLLVREG
jgi:predicted NUDIX family phosphoesterase